jgi:hypothetical protein
MKAGQCEHIGLMISGLCDVFLHDEALRVRADLPLHDASVRHLKPRLTSSGTPCVFADGNDRQYRPDRHAPAAPRAMLIDLRLHAPPYFNVAHATRARTNLRSRNARSVFSGHGNMLESSAHGFTLA